MSSIPGWDNPINTRFTQLFSDTANALRSVLGTTVNFTPAQIPYAINSINTIPINITNEQDLTIINYPFNMNVSHDDFINIYQQGGDLLKSQMYINTNVQDHWDSIYGRFLFKDTNEDFFSNYDYIQIGRNVINTYSMFYNAEFKNCDILSHSPYLSNLFRDSSNIDSINLIINGNNSLYNDETNSYYIYLNDLFYNCYDFNNINITIDCNYANYNIVCDITNMFANNIYLYNLSNISIQFTNISSSYNALFIGQETFYSDLFFNSPIPFIDNFMGGPYCLAYCYNFNQEITFSSYDYTIDNRIGSLSSMFKDCYKLNSFINFNNSYFYNISSLFEDCHIFNQPINITLIQKNNDWDGKCSGYAVFRNCYNFNQDIYIHGIDYSQNVDLSYMMQNCDNFGSNIYIYNHFISSLSYTFSNCNNSLKKSIFWNGFNDDYINTYTGYIVTYSPLAVFDPLPDGNGYYNSVYNIYLQNNIGEEV